MSTPRTDKSCVIEGHERLLLPHGRDSIQELQTNTYTRLEAPRCKLDERLEILLGRWQKSIVNQMEKLSESPLALSPNSTSFSWIGECVRLQNFYSSLRYLPEPGPALKICIAIREDVYQKASVVRFSQGFSAFDIEQLQRAAISKAWERVGNIVYCAENVPQELDVVIASSEFEDVLLFAEKKVACDLQKIWGVLNINSKVADTHALQGVGRVFLNELPKEIAKILVTSQGQLNLGMIRPIKERFFPKNKILSDTEQGILFILNRINSSWQKLFDKIEVPKSPNIASNAMIRADLGLFSGEEITKIHCQQEVLGAVLSQLCNQQVGDCFTRAWALKRHNEYLLESIEDYTSLIRNGYLTRILGEKTEYFFFENTLANDSICSTITLKQNGPVIEFSGPPFWKCPNLISACRLMGILDLEKRKDDFLNQAQMLKGEGKSVTWNDLINFCAESAADSEKDVNAMLALGRYGFNLCNNRLLKAWETCLAVTVDSYSASSVRESINKTVMNMFNDVFEKRAAKVSHYDRTLIEEMKFNFQNALNRSFHVVYDESIPLPYCFTDGSFAVGGFKLFQKEFRDLTNKGIRVATPEQFQTFVLGVITTLSTQKKEVIVITSVVDALQRCVLKSDFMKNVIYSYEIENADHEDPIGNYEYIDQTPMTSLSDDYCPEFMTIDAVNQFNPNIKAILSKNPGELLRWMLHLAKWRDTTKFYLEEEVIFPDLLIEGAEFQNFLQSKMPVEEWIKKMVIDPGIAVSRAKIDLFFETRYQTMVKAWLKEQLISKTPRGIGDVEKFFTKLNAKAMTVQQFAQRSYHGLLNIFHHDADLVRALSLVLDGFFLKSLSEKNPHSIQKSSVCFAKEDSHLELNAVFLCYFFNPRTEQIDLGSIALDKTNLKPMDQQEWEEVWKGL